MRKKFMEGFKKFTAMFVLIQMVMVLLPVQTAFADADVRICHAAGNSGKYEEIWVSPEGAYSGHDSNSHQDGRDIIPFVRNWDTDGIAIWNNKCEVPVSVINTKPIITLLGANPMTIEKGTNFVDPGAEAYDAEEGDKTSYIAKTGTVNSNVTGIYYVYYNVSDSKGLAADQKTREVNVVDTTAPAVPTGLGFESLDRGTSFACGTTTTLQPVIPVWNDNTESDFSHYEYTSFHPNGSIGLDETLVYTSEFVNSWMPPADGAYGFAVRAVDTTGNKSDWAPTSKTLGGSCQIIYVAGEIDEQAPAQPTVDLRATSDTGYSTTDNITADNTPTFDIGNLESGSTVTVFADGVSLGSFITPEGFTVWSFTPIVSMSDGTYVITAMQKDTSNNESALSAPLVPNLVIDTIAPDVTIVTPDDGALLSGTVEIRGSVEDDNPYRYWFVVENSNGVNILSSAISGTIYDSSSFINKLLADWDTTNFLDGYYTIKLEARDAAGNKDTGSIDWHLVLVDNTPPVVTLLGNDPLYLNEGEVYNDPGCVVTDNYDPSPTWLASQGTVDTSVVGTYYVTCSAQDAAGNVGFATREVIVLADEGDGTGGDETGGETTPPVVLTPATPVVAAVAGEFTEAAEVAEEQDVSSETTDEEEGEILGEEDEEEGEERCDWWWILSIILAIVLGGNYLLAKKYHENENLRKVLMVTPVGFGLLTLYAHQVLGDGLKHVPWCYYLWLIVAVLVAAYYLIKNYLGKKETSK